MAEIEYSLVDQVAWIRHNRPKVKNSFTLVMVYQWAQFLHMVMRTSLYLISSHMAVVQTNAKTDDALDAFRADQRERSSGTKV
jgi:hypothetical protein